MRLIKITAENFKGLRLVEWTPRPGVNTVAGENSCGKSSLLDSVVGLILGPKFSPDRPIRDGELEARVVGEFGDYTLTRTWKRDAPDGEITHKLVVTSADGGVRKRPQEIADGFLDAISIDPITFFALPPAKQRDWLLDVVGLREELDRLDGLRKARYEDRRVANVARETLAGQRAAYPSTITAAEPVDVAALLGELSAARSKNDAAAAHARNAEESERVCQRINDEILATESRLRELRANLESARAQAKKLHESRLETVDTSPIEAKIAGAQAANAAAAAAKSAADLDSKIATVDAKSAALTAEIAKIDADKSNLLAGAAWPTPEIGVDDAAVTWNGVPLSQGATNEQIRASIALALVLLKKHPLKLLVVRDSTNLTRESREQVVRMITEAGVDAYLEEADDDHEASPECIVLVDGVVQP